MIQEAYCSYKVSKLLKEKGCDYPNQGMIAVHNSDGTHEIRNVCSQAVAMRWLREEHDLHIDIGYDDLEWFWNIISVSEEVPLANRPKMIKNGTACHRTYEQAVESALAYTLEHLI